MDPNLSLHDNTKSNYRKRFIPIECNPQVFNTLITKLGVTDLAFFDVYSVEDPEVLAYIPRPVVALVLVSPSTLALANNQRTLQEEAKRQVYTGYGADEPVFWIGQTIHNACGLYAIIHALANNECTSQITPGSPFNAFLTKAVSLPPLERALALENARDIEDAYAVTAVQGDSVAPALDDEVDFHYSAYVKGRDGKIYEMDGVKKGPVDTGICLTEGDDLLSEGALQIIRRWIKNEGDNVWFSLLALAKAPNV